MEKKMLTQEMLESGLSFSELGFEYVSFLPYVLCEECAFELAARTVIVDQEDAVFYRYNTEMIECFFKFKYFTSVDTDDWQTDDGMYALYDFARRTKCFEDTDICSAGWREVCSICEYLYDAMCEMVKAQNSAARRIDALLDTVLGSETLPKEMAANADVNEKMIDALMMIKSEEAKASKEKALTMFAKK